MSRCRRHAAAAAALVLCGITAPALAHKLRVFAAAEGDLISGAAYFAGGAPAGGARVKVLDAQGQTLATLQPDADGRFSYRAPAAMDLRVVAETGDGHRTEWLIPASDLAGAFGTATPGSPAPAPGSPDAVAERPAPQPGPVGAPTAGATDPALEAAIERALARQLRPLREEIQAAEDRTRLRDLLGGLGYIAGLAGLALWWDARRRGLRP